MVTTNTGHRNKYTPPWAKKPGVVTNIKGNSISITHRGNEIMRSSEQVKPYYKSNNTRSIHNDYNSDESSSDSEGISSDTDTINTIPYDDENELNATIALEEDDDIDNPEQIVQPVVVEPAARERQEPAWMRSGQYELSKCVGE